MQHPVMKHPRQNSAQSAGACFIFLRMVLWYHQVNFNWSLIYAFAPGSNNQSRVLNGGGPLSESSVSSLPRKQIKGQHWDWLSKIWLHLAELCLHSKQRDQALKCIEEAIHIHSTTAAVLIAVIFDLHVESTKLSNNCVTERTDLWIWRKLCRSEELFWGCHITWTWQS